MLIPDLDVTIHRPGLRSSQPVDMPHPAARDQNLLSCAYPNPVSVGINIGHVIGAAGRTIDPPALTDGKAVDSRMSADNVALQILDRSRCRRPGQASFNKIRAGSIFLDKTDIPTLFFDNRNQFFFPGQRLYLLLVHVPQGETGPANLPG